MIIAHKMMMSCYSTHDSSRVLSYTPIRIHSLHRFGLCGVKAAHILVAWIQSPQRPSHAIPVSRNFTNCNPLVGTLPHQVRIVLQPRFPSSYHQNSSGSSGKLDLKLETLGNHGKPLRSYYRIENYHKHSQTI